MAKKLNREDVRDALVAFMETHGLRTGKAASVALGTIGEHTVTRIVNRSERPMGNHQLSKVMDAINAHQATALVAVTAEPDPTLPVARHTGMLNEREHDGQPVYTLADVADGLGVTYHACYQVWKNPRKGFVQGRDWFEVSLNGRAPMALFPRRGAMRLAMHSDGPNALALQDHLLDLDETASGRQAPEGSMLERYIIELDKRRDVAIGQVEAIAQVADMKADEAKQIAEDVAGRLSEHDPIELRSLFAELLGIEKEAAAMYKARGEKFNFAQWRKPLKAANGDCPVSQLANTQTVSALRTVVGVAREMLAGERRKGLKLFGSEALAKAPVELWGDLVRAIAERNQATGDLLNGSAFVGVDGDKGILSIQAPNQIIAEQIQRNPQRIALIESGIKAFFGKPLRLKVV